MGSIKIEHIAIWVSNLEKTREFYVKYFGAVSNAKYHNEQKQFQSYFLSFQAGCRIELMNRPDVYEDAKDHEHQKLGIIHFAMSMGSREAVDGITEQLRKDGYAIIGEPRTTGDGYYESVVLDPEKNIVEITV